MKLSTVALALALAHVAAATSNLRTKAGESCEACFQAHIKKYPTQNNCRSCTYVCKRADGGECKYCPKAQGRGGGSCFAKSVGASLQAAVHGGSRCSVPWQDRAQGRVPGC